MLQNALRVGLEAMYKALASVELESIMNGKPEAATYKYADELIEPWIG